MPIASRVPSPLALLVSVLRSIGPARLTLFPAVVVPHASRKLAIAPRESPAAPARLKKPRRLCAAKICRKSSESWLSLIDESSHFRLVSRQAPHITDTRQCVETTTPD